MMKNLLLKTMFVVFVATSINPIKAESSFDYYFPKFLAGVVACAAIILGYVGWKANSSKSKKDDNQDRSESTSSVNDALGQKLGSEVVSAAGAPTVQSSLTDSTDQFREDINNDLTNSRTLEPAQAQGADGSISENNQQQASLFTCPDLNALRLRLRVRRFVAQPRSYRIDVVFFPSGEKDPKEIPGRLSSHTLDQAQRDIFSQVQGEGVQDQDLVMLEMHDNTIGDPITTIEQLRKQKKVVVLSQEKFNVMKRRAVEQQQKLATSFSANNYMD